MEHLTVEAVATATDLGEFTAIAATYTVDRQNEQIRRGAFESTIRRWQASGKQIPLHYDHRGDAASIIGTVDPASLREEPEGLRVSGRLDLEGSETAREVWRSMKAGAMSLSFGFLSTRARKRSDGVRELSEIDLFEISVVPHPANPDTRFLSLKSTDNHQAEIPTAAELRRWAERLGVIESDPELAKVRSEARRHMLAALGAGDTGTDELRETCDAISRELKHLQPIQIASFGC